MLKFITIATGIGLIVAGLVEVIVVNTGWRRDWTMPLVLAVSIVGWLWYEFRHGRVSATRPENSENLHRLLFQMAAALLVFTLGMAGVSWFSEPLNYISGAIAVLGLIATIPAVVRWMALIQAARENPSLIDERIVENAGKSERWAFLACFEMALIFGMVDHLDIISISGATVGFSVAIGGIFIGLVSQAYYEWRDGK